MRTFIALVPGDELTERVDVVLRRLSRLAPSARWVRPESLHLTLAYLGEVRDALVPHAGDVVARVAAAHPKHVLRVHGSGTFGPIESPKVLWTGVSGDVAPLRALQKSLVEELAPLGMSPDFETFTPHITLARAKHPRGDEALSRVADALSPLDFGQFVVREVALFASHAEVEGMHYRPVETHVLRGGRSSSS